MNEDCEVDEDDEVELRRFRFVALDVVLVVDEELIVFVPVVVFVITCGTNKRGFSRNIQYRRGLLGFLIGIFRLLFFYMGLNFSGFIFG